MGGYATRGPGVCRACGSNCTCGAGAARKAAPQIAVVPPAPGIGAQPAPRRISKERGVCPVCGREFQITPNGIRAHDRGLGLCPGSGRGGR